MSPALPLSYSPSEIGRGARIRTWDLTVRSRLRKCKTFLHPEQAYSHFQLSQGHHHARYLATPQPRVEFSGTACATPRQLKNTSSSVRFWWIAYFVLAPTYSPRRLRQVPSALAGLTSEFGMGSGVTPPPKHQHKICNLLE